MTDPPLPPEAYAAALAALPGIGPVRLAALLRDEPPERAWQRVAAERASVPSRLTPSAVWASVLAAGVTVHVVGAPGYPPTLLDDQQPPGVLFTQGTIDCIQGARVAVVGTRRCSRYGREVAYELGRDLAAAGVRVVSGLALGIDGAAHTGALAAGAPGGVAAPPVAVVGSGLDVVYPRRHHSLWKRVAEAGVVLSEAPMGAAPEPWRFPVRNRIIAALADVVVVVESPHAGGSRHTVEAAIERGRPVMAVPGPVRSSTSDLPNALLAEGCQPVRDALDVLVALGLGSAAPGARRGQADVRPPPDASGEALLGALGWQPAAFEELVQASGRSPGEVSVTLAHLERDGWVVGNGGWWERAGDQGR